ncbi:MAG: hypothetical protein ACLRHW_20130, partial [Coprobacillus cateniformis]
MNELTKEQITKVNNSRHKIRCSSHNCSDGKDFAHELDRDTYMKIGANITIDKADKHLLVDTKCADKELDIFSLKNMSADNRTLLVLSQEEFDKLKQEEKGKKFKNHELEYTHNGEEPLAQSYIKNASAMNELDHSYIQTINDNRESLVSNIEGMDM